MQKDFDLWNEQKKDLDIASRHIYPRMKEIWYVKIGVNIGDEENGKTGFVRPVLVIKKIGSLLFVVPLTTKLKYDSYHYHITTMKYGGKQSFLILSQGRVIDRRRFYKKLGNIDRGEYLYIKKLLYRMYL